MLFLSQYSSCKKIAVSALSLAVALTCGLSKIYAETTLNAGVSVVNTLSTHYQIAPGDVLSFSINEEPDFEQSNIIVRRDGYATIRPIGQIHVAGKSVQSLTRLLETQLDQHIKNPQVYINIQQFHAPKIYLFGAVMHPGLYQPALKKERNESKFVQDNPELTVSNVLIASGGVSYNADLSRVIVSGPGKEPQEVNLLNMMLYHDASQDILLDEGDTVEVPELKESQAHYGDETFKSLSAAGLYPEKFPVRVLGEVGKPGLFYVASDTPYLNTALALAEGLRMNAVKQAVYISRRDKDNKMSRYTVDPKKYDMVLRPNDVIEVKDSYTAKAGRGLNSAAQISLPFVWFFK